MVAFEFTCSGKWRTATGLQSANSVGESVFFINAWGELTCTSINLLVSFKIVSRLWKRHVSISVYSFFGYLDDQIIKLSSLSDSRTRTTSLNHTQLLSTCLPVDTRVSHIRPKGCISPMRPCTMSNCRVISHQNKSCPSIFEVNL